MLWIIYYDDETTFGSEDGTWSEAPTDGVQIIIDHIPETPLAHMGSDYYLLRDDVIMSFSERDLHQHLVLGIDRHAIKFGRWTTHDIWHRVHEKALGVPGK